MKKIFLFLISFISLSAYSQVYIKPHAVLCPQNYFRMKQLSLDTVEITSDETILYFTAIAYREWVNIKKEVFLQSLDGKEKYSFIRAEGIPVAPRKHYFDQTNPYLKFKLFFEKIPSTLDQFDFIECPDDDNCFNIYDISLKFGFEKENEYSDFIEKYVPFTLWKHFYVSPQGDSEENSFDDVFYSELLKSEKVFNINESFHEPTKDVAFKSRVLSFVYDGNSLSAVFDVKKSLYNLKLVSIDFESEEEAISFLNRFSEYFHMIKTSDNSYHHSRFLGRYILQEGKRVLITTLV